MSEPVDTSPAVVLKRIEQLEHFNWPVTAAMMRALLARVQALEVEVEHWVGRYNELEAWRAQTSRLHLAAEARVKELEVERAEALASLLEYARRIRYDEPRALRGRNGGIP
jgi:hypothetical protein